jgi:predicted TIM-barrel fold metal-dependent hydrolase
MRKFLACAVVLLGTVSVAKADGILPLFDTHVHYSQPAWQAFNTDEIFKILKNAGVAKALVSSTPDDGTLKLYNLRKDVVVPSLRPYRDGANSSNWFTQQATLEYLTERLRKGIYKAIGEFHLFDPRSALTPQVKELVKLAVKYDIYLQIHSDALPVAVLFDQNPKLKILWAHAGMSEPAATVGKMLDRYKNLWTGVSFRAGDIAPGGNIDKAWKDLILRHSDRFVYGTDTYITGRWGEYLSLVKEHRNWIDQLPRDVAEKVAFRNAVRLFDIKTGFPQ